MVSQPLLRVHRTTLDIPLALGIRAALSRPDRSASEQEALDATLPVVARVERIAGAAGWVDDARDLCGGGPVPAIYPLGGEVATPRPNR